MAYQHINPLLLSANNTSNGAVLASNGSSAYWTNYSFVNWPAFSVYANNSATSIANTNQQIATFNNKDFDTANCYNATGSTATLNGLTVPAWSFCPNVPGYYQINSTVRLNGNVGIGEQMLVVWKNGTEWKRGWNASGVSWANNWYSMAVSTLVYLNGTGDYCSIYVQQGSNVTQTITGGSNISYFNGSMVRGG